MSAQSPIRLYAPDPDGGGAFGTVAELFAQFLDHAKADGRYAQSTLDQRRHVHDPFLATFGPRPPQTLRTAEVEDWLHRRADWSASTRRTAFNALAAVFKWGARRGSIDANPFAQATRPRDGPRGQDMQPAEFCALVRVASAAVRHPLYFAAWTGCRPGEWARATWPEVDWRRACIVLTEHKTARSTGKPRVIPLVPRCLRLLKWLQAKSSDPSGPVFLTETSVPWNKGHWVQTMARLCARAGIRQLPWKSIRHMVGTHLVKDGRPIKLVSLALGHASVVTTERYYLHLGDQIDAMRDALDGRPE